MGASGSKAIARTAPRAASAAQSEVAQAVSSAERAREQRLLELQQEQGEREALEEQACKDEQLVSSMRQLMGSMAQRQVDVSGSTELQRRFGWRKVSMEEKEAQLQGRLDTLALKALFEERARAAAQGQPPPSPADLARRYGARQEVLERVLKHASVPLVHEASDGRLIGSWPPKR